MALPHHIKWLFCSTVKTSYNFKLFYGNGTASVLSQTVGSRRYPLNLGVNTARVFSVKTKVLPKTDEYSQLNKEQKENITNPIKKRLELISEKERILTIPNVLTISRIGLSPVLGYLVIHSHFTTACGLFLLVGATDLLDGWIARHFEGQSSAFGSFLDPLADKILVSIMFISLTIANLIPVPLTALIILRDVLLVMAAFYVRFISLEQPRTITRYFDATMKTAQLQPLFLSKVNTALQLGLVALSLAAPVFHFVDHPALQALWWTTAATTFITGIQYIFAKNTFKILADKSKQSDSRKL